MGGWQDYLNFLLKDACTEEAYILDLQGNIAASNIGIQALPVWQKIVQIDEVNKETHNVDERAVLLEGRPKNAVGVHINKVKYFALNLDADRGVWYLKKDHGGACIAWTNKAILIGVWNEEKKQTDGKAQNPGDCNKRVEDLSKMLRDAGW